MTHELRTTRHTDEVEMEFLQNADSLITYYVSTGTEGHQVGDAVVLTSSDGDVFIGEVADKDDATATLWLSLV